MKKPNQFRMLLVAALITVSGSVFAQVKIGTNPTTIDPANNLEVEASTAGRKTSINKTTGQVTIKDGTEGDGRILTSDANGGASWKPFGTVIITGADNSPDPVYITPPTAELIPNCPITLNKGIYELIYYAQYDYITDDASGNHYYRSLNPTNSSTLNQTFPSYIYFSFQVISGAATLAGDSTHRLPVLSHAQVGARISQFVNVTADNTVIKPRYWLIASYGRVSNIGAITAVKF
jgi:hypothetical protein